MIDADNFKAINDQYGHNAGDQAIKLFLKLFNHAFDLMISLYVMVGDEFVLIFQDIYYDALQVVCIKLVNV